MTLDEIIEKAIPLNMTCRIEQQKAERRRVELKKNIELLLRNAVGNINQSGVDPGAFRREGMH